MSEKIKTAILTVSSTRVKETDLSAEEIKNILKTDDFEILSADIVSDDKEMIKDKLKYFSDECRTDIIITTGGTGLGPFDVTPEATLEVIERIVPGIPELIRIEGFKNTKKAMLSRGVSGIRGQTLIVNLPGSPAGAKESLEAILEIIPHAIHMLKGGGH